MSRAVRRGKPEKKLQRVPVFQLMLSEEQFRAIGHMATQWAFLESEIDRELIWLHKRSEHKRKRMNFRDRFVNRANQWLTMATRTYKKHPKRVKAVEQISRKAINIKCERDDLIHGNLSSSGTFFKIRSGRCIDISDTVGTAPHIEDLACRISEISAALFRHQVELQHLFRTSP